MAKIDNRVTNLEVNMAQVAEHMKSVSELLTALNKKMDGLDHIIRGNGSPGLASRVSVLEDSRSIETSKTEHSWKLWALIASLVANVAQMGVSLWK